MVDASGKAAPLYRWKGFDRASGWSFRCRAQHNIGERAFRRTFTIAKVDEAERAAGSDENIPALAAVRAGKLLDFMREHRGGKMERRALVCSLPMQELLSELTAAEKHSTTLVGVLAMIPASSVALDTSVDSAMQTSVEANRMFING